MKESFQMRKGDMEVGMMLGMLSWRNRGVILVQKMKSAQSAQK